MVSSDGIRGYHDLMILGILLDGDSYGYEISKEITARTGGRYQVKETTLYSAMNRLEKQGCIASYSGTQSKGKPRTYFTLTTYGREYYREKCSEWTLTSQIVQQFVKEEIE